MMCVCRKVCTGLHEIACDESANTTCSFDSWTSSLQVYLKDVFPPKLLFAYQGIPHDQLSEKAVSSKPESFGY
ncbi:hypothetical protein Tco_0704025 [Tanacetum coccineum]|uniref:Uncharacterized protein n=1 Tax=Tanacetum coccineum TaxID=301880 RepID=A0ABQ4Y0I0_9ASTR